MKTIEYLTILEDCARDFRGSDISKDIERNTHLHNCKEKNINQDIIDSVLVCFINYIGNRMSVELGLCSKDLVDKNWRKNE